MGETSSSVPPKGIGTVDFWKDLGKGAFIAAVTNLLLGVYTIVQNNQLPTGEDWATMLKSTLAILIAYFIKNLGTNNVGEMFAKNKPVTTVSTEKLEEVVEQAKDANTK